MLKYIFSLLLSLMLLSIYMPVACAQEIDLEKALWIQAASGDEIHPSWSPDGELLLYLSKTASDSEVMIYDLDADTSLQITHGLGNIMHPVWHPDGKHIVFDLEAAGSIHLYKFNLETEELSLLFHRAIQSQEACFPDGGRMVYFTGYDEVTERWHIYSYDFIYDNLNQLNDAVDRCHTPKISPDGKLILFEEEYIATASKALVLSNWYGQVESRFSALGFQDPGWDPGGLKIWFVSGKDEKIGALYSMWSDYSHLEKHMSSPYTIRWPVVSPDASMLAMAIKKYEDFDMVIIKLDYF